jgi:hypothetical protein
MDRRRSGLSWSDSRGTNSSVNRVRERKAEYIAFSNKRAVQLSFNRIAHRDGWINGVTLSCDRGTLEGPSRTKSARGWIIQK